MKESPRAKDTPRETGGIAIRNRRRLDSASKLLLDKHPFYGHLIMQMKRIYDRDLTTYSSIQVRDRSIILYLHPDIETLQLQNISAIMENACLYLVLGYLRNRKYIENDILDNISGAIAANELSSAKSLMKEMGSPTVEEFDKFKSKETKEWYYESLKELMEKMKQKFKMESPLDGQGGQSGEDGEEGEEGDGSDSDARDPGDAKPGRGKQGNARSQADPSADQGEPSEGEGGDGVPGEDSDGNEPLTEEQQRALEKALEEAAETINKIQSDPRGSADEFSEKAFKEILQHGKMSETDADTGAVKHVLKNAMQEAFKKSRGVTPGNISKLVSEILETKTMPWNVILRRHMLKSVKFDSSKTWMRESRRLPGIVRGKKFDHRCNIYILLDTSGSIGEKYISVFSNEMKTMVKHGHKVMVIPCDTQVHTPYRFIDRIHVWEGGGGTTLYPAIKYIKEESKDQVDLCIILTDGYCDVFPKPSFPVIWALQKDCKAPVDWGLQIQLKE